MALFEIEARGKAKFWQLRGTSGLFERHGGAEWANVLAFPPFAGDSLHFGLGEVVAVEPGANVSDFFDREGRWSGF